MGAGVVPETMSVPDAPPVRAGFGGGLPMADSGLINRSAEIVSVVRVDDRQPIGGPAVQGDAGRGVEGDMTWPQCPRTPRLSPTCLTRSPPTCAPRLPLESL